MKSQRNTVLVKAEATAGTDATPSASTDGFGVVDFAWAGAAKAVTDEFVYDAGYYGARDKFMVSLTRECNFVLPVIGGGAAGTNYGAALLAFYRAAGHAAAISAGVSVIYNPVNSGEESVTLYVNEDGIFRKMTYGRASMKWEFSEGKVPRCMVNMLGLYSTPTDQTVPTPTYPTLQKPVGFSKANTVVTLGALGLKCTSVLVDGGRSWAYRNLAGAEDIVPIDCKPTAELKFELPTVASKAVYTELETTVAQALSVVHGVTAGNIVTIAATKAQLVDLSETKDRGTLFVTAKLELLPTAGGDQYTYKIT